jgi:glycosyltransferase involved in cell wall biosynthesis
MSDLFVHGALEEGFGLAICEAASAGLNVLVHNSRHFEWLVGDASCLVDMSKPGPLSDRLQEYVRSGRVQSDRNTLLARNIRDRFDWDALAPQYVEMYRKVAGH